MCLCALGCQESELGVLFIMPAPGRRLPTRMSSEWSGLAVCVRDVSAREKWTFGVRGGSGLARAAKVCKSCALCRFGCFPLRFRVFFWRVRVRGQGQPNDLTCRCGAAGAPVR